MFSWRSMLKRVFSSKWMKMKRNLLYWIMQSLIFWSWTLWSFCIWNCETPIMHTYQRESGNWVQWFCETGLGSCFYFTVLVGGFFVGLLGMLVAMWNFVDNLGLERNLQLSRIAGVFGYCSVGFSLLNAKSSLHNLLFIEEFW